MYDKFLPFLYNNERTNQRIPNSPAHGMSQLDSLSTLIWLNLFLVGNVSSVSVCADVVGVEFKNSSLACCSFFWRISGECRFLSRSDFVNDRSNVRLLFFSIFFDNSAFGFSVFLLPSAEALEQVLLELKIRRFSCTDSLRCGRVTCIFPEVITPTLADFWTSFRGPCNRNNKLSGKHHIFVYH